MERIFKVGELVCVLSTNPAADLDDINLGEAVADAVPVPDAAETETTEGEEGRKEEKEAAWCNEVVLPDLDRESSARRE